MEEEEEEEGVEKATLQFDNPSSVTVVEEVVEEGKEEGKEVVIS